ncbi:MAG: hypothetical protein ABTQ34_09290 [Bdellovibrionales bacterium]
MRFLFRVSAVPLCVLAFSVPVCASSMEGGSQELTFATSSLVQDFDWLSTWGSVDTVGNEDFIVPSSLLPVKAEIRSTLKSCISDAGKLNQAHLKVYLVDFNGDDINDILVDWGSYYQSYSSDSPSCAARLCSSEQGCAVGLYAVGEARQLLPSSEKRLIEGGGFPSLFAIPGGSATCPDDPEDNAQCISGCPATEDLCPAMFTYDMRKVWDGQARTGTFMTVERFSSLMQGQAMYAARNANPVLALEHGGKDQTRCGADELGAHDGRCVKYYQFVGDQAQGAFADLHGFSGNSEASVNPSMPCERCSQGQAETIISFP